MKKMLREYAVKEVAEWNERGGGNIRVAARNSHTHGVEAAIWKVLDNHSELN